MNKQEYFKFAEGFFNNCLETSRKKNSDYTGGSENPFSNFKSVEALFSNPDITAIGFLTRMMDKMKRIASFVEKGELKVKDESVTDTLQDLANYSCLLAGYIKSQDEINEVELEFQEDTCGGIKPTLSYDKPVDDHDNDVGIYSFSDNNKGLIAFMMDDEGLKAADSGLLVNIEAAIANGNIVRQTPR